MNNTIGNLIDTEFGKAYDSGYEAGIMEAVRILSDAQLANDVHDAQNKAPDGEAVYELPDGREVCFDEKESYYTSVADSLSDIKEKITRSTHEKHSWDNWIEPFAVSLINGVHTKAELIALGAEHDLSANAVNKKAWELGYGKNRGEDYFVKKHSPLPKYVDIMKRLSE